MIMWILVSRIRCRGFIPLKQSEEQLFIELESPVAGSGQVPSTKPFLDAVLLRHVTMLAQQLSIISKIIVFAF